MNLKFLEQKFNENKFQEFIIEAFDEFELVDGNYKIDKLNESDKEHISEYRYLGEAFLDDDSEVGVLILRSTTKNIENKRVGFSKVISKLSKPYGKEIILVAIYHEDSPIWRLTFVSYDFKGGKQITRTDAKRYTYVMGEDIVLTTAKSRIGMLFSNSSTSQELIEEIFSVEKVSREFFDKYKRLYADTLKELQPQIALFGDEKGLALFTKKLLGRIVFLYFLQKKGWLASDENWENGDKKFLRNCFDGKYKEYNDFYTQILQPLFFEALNQDRAKENDNFKLLDVHIPYLNGGLFMRDVFDKEDRVILENEIFKKIFGLFDQYNFTIIESNPNDSEVAIDPEMLGRIFEDLLEDRKDKGAFYTPREIVHYMCQQSIKNYLETKPKEQTELEYIKEMKILDPAIGSGAFPMGMLHEIVEKRLDLGDTTDIATIKIETIQNSIYGVDIEPSAVEIAKLRFWLSIVVDEEKPSPLPNLSYKIMVGNSLISTINGLDPLVQNQNKKAQKEIKLLQSKFYDYFNEHDAKKKEKIDATIKANINTILNKTIKNFDIQPRLEMDKKEQKKYEEDMENHLLLSKIIKEYNEHNYTQELFFYKIYFNEVFKDNKGFDVVIGNPPYVRHEKIKELKPKLKSEGYKAYAGSADLYIYFFELAYNLLNTNGIVNFITSNTYVNTRYAEKFREFIIKNVNVLSYIDFSQVQLFDSATVATSILMFNNENKKNKSFQYCDSKGYKKDENLELFVQENKFDYIQKDLKKEGFIFASKKELEIKKAIDKVGKKLKDWEVLIKSGIKTGFNEAYILTESKKNELVDKNIKNTEIIQPLLRGRDVEKYKYNFANKWLIVVEYEAHKYLEYEYPDIYKYLNEYKIALSKRGQCTNRGGKGQHHWLELDNNPTSKYFELLQKEKILWLELTDNSKFTLDTKGYYLDMTVFFMTGKNLKYLLALLNSKLIYWYFNLICAESGVGTNRWKKIYVEQLPIPKIPKQQQELFEILVDYILFAKEQNLTLESSLFESVIDGMVYDLYFEDEMRKFDCFISDEVSKIVLEMFGAKAFDSNIDKLYRTFKESKTVQRGLRDSRGMPMVKLINGDIIDRV